MRSTPIIYLRDKFSIKPGLVGSYFEGKQNLLNALQGTGVHLIAACGEQPLIKGKPVPEVLPPMMNIWRLPHWNTLYDLMYEFSEQDWYAREVSSLKIEHQDLLIKVGPGIDTSPRNPWTGRSVYLYDEIRLNVATTKMQHLHDLNWFKAVVETKFDWKLIWIASEVTGIPGQLCLLWEIPETPEYTAVQTIERTTAYFAYDAEQAVRDRYAQMMEGIESLHRKYMYPESTEQYDDQLPKPAPKKELTRHELARRLLNIQNDGAAPAPLAAAANK
jgi:hypothetical protein